MAHIINMDRVINPRPVTFISPVDGLERGIFVEIEGMAANNLWQAGAEPGRYVVHPRQRHLADRVAGKRTGYIYQEAECGEPGLFRHHLH